MRENLLVLGAETIPFNSFLEEAIESTVPAFVDADQNCQMVQIKEERRLSREDTVA